MRIHTIPETKEMNVDECIRGRLLWQTWTNVVNHAALCITTCCTQPRRKMAKVNQLSGDYAEQVQQCAGAALRKIIRGLWRRRGSFHFTFTIDIFTMIYRKHQLKILFSETVGCIPKKFVLCIFRTSIIRWHYPPKNKLIVIKCFLIFATIIVFNH